jgi:hypothetical protein
VVVSRVRANIIVNCKFLKQILQQMNCICFKGKSTIVKQMKILHRNGFTQNEYLEYKSIVFSNTIESLKSILLAMNALHIQYADSERKHDAKRFFVQTEKTIEFNKDLANVMKRLWADRGTQMCFERSREYQLHDSAK